MKESKYQDLVNKFKIKYTIKNKTGKADNGKTSIEIIPKFVSKNEVEDFEYINKSDKINFLMILLLPISAYTLSKMDNKISLLLSIPLLFLAIYTWTKNIPDNAEYKGSKLKTIHKIKRKKELKKIPVEATLMSDIYNENVCNDYLKLDLSVMQELDNETYMRYESALNKLLPVNLDNLNPKGLNKYDENYIVSHSILKAYILKFEILQNILQSISMQIDKELPKYKNNSKEKISKKDYINRATKIYKELMKNYESDIKVKELLNSFEKEANNYEQLVKLKNSTEAQIVVKKMKEKIRR